MECHEGNLDEGSIITQEFFADVRALPKNTQVHKKTQRHEMPPYKEQQQIQSGSTI